MRHRLGTLAVWGIVLTVAAAAGVYSLRNGRAALGLSLALLVISIVFADGGRGDFFGKYGWIPWAWIALALTPDMHFTYRSPLDTSVTTTSAETFAQLIIYGLVAALVLSSRRLLVTGGPTHIRAGPLLLWPVLALASTVWSLVPLFTFVRALQLLVPISLTLLMVRLWLSSPKVAAAVWRNTLRLFVRVVTALVLLGFAGGFWREPRFTWPGLQAGVASMYMGVGLLILIACGRSFLGFRMPGYVARLSLFGVGLYFGDTRGVIAALLVGIAVWLWSTGRTKPLAKYVGIPYFAIGLALILIAARPEILKYLARGETSQGIASLNGRIPLWWLSFDLLANAGRWFTGFGYGAARVILPTHFAWAGTAHSSWVELLLAVGILGPLLAAADIIYVSAYASSRRAVTSPSLTLSLLAFLMVVSITSESLVFPGLGFVLLVLLHAPVLAQRSALVSSTGDHNATDRSQPNSTGAARNVASRKGLARTHVVRQV